MLGPAIFSLALGRSKYHSFDAKISQAAIHGYRGIEIFYEDLVTHAETLPGGATEANLVIAAHQIKDMCAKFDIFIISLQPYKNYEGCLDRQRHREMLDELRLWFKLCHALGTDLIGLPSTIEAKGYTGDRGLIVPDLRELADLGAQETPAIRFGYEALCFGAYVNTWAQSWEIVQEVDRKNFGIVLDTFNIAGRDYADPGVASGKIEEADRVLGESLKKLRRVVDVEKVFLVQIVDAERMRDPINKDHAFYIEGSDTRMGWSRNARLFAFEEPGYLPIIDILKAICDQDGLRYDGWLSAELFSRSFESPDKDVPATHARRGRISWEKTVQAMGWNGSGGYTSSGSSSAMVSGASTPASSDFQMKL